MLPQTVRMHNTARTVARSSLTPTTRPRSARGNFKKATVQHYYKALYGKDTTAKDAVLIALDTSKAAALAKDILFMTKDGWRTGLPAQLSSLGLPKSRIIQKLNK